MSHRVYCVNGMFYIDIRNHLGRRTRRSLATRDADEAANRAAAYAAVPSPRQAPVAAAPPARTARQIMARLRERSKRRGHSCDISEAEIALLLARANGRCEVTGLPFSTERLGWSKAPFSASIDRIDGTRPYSFQNCRVVCLATNVAINEWGLDVFAKLAKGYTHCVSVGTHPGTHARQAA